MSGTISVTEGQPVTYQLTASASGGPGNTFVWRVDPRTGTASAADFVADALPSGSVTWDPDRAAPVISFATLDDTLREPDETFRIVIEVVSLVSEGPILFQSVDGLIVDNDNPVASISPASLTETEGNAGTTTFSYSVTLDRPAPDNATISWFVNGTGSGQASGADFAGGVLPSGAVTVLPGQSGPFTISIPVQGDAVVETAESFTVVLSGATSGILIGPARSATGTITNDDLSLASIAPATQELEEGNPGVTAFNYTITLDQAAVSDGIASLDWQVSGTGPNPAIAADFVDGTLPFGTVTFAPGATSATITVPVLGDFDPEPDEDFVVTLTAPPGPIAVAPGASSATGRILDDDTSTVTIDPPAQSVLEGDGGVTTAITYTLTLDQPQRSIPTTVDWSVTSGSADAADFVNGVLPSGTATFGFASSATITLPVLGDDRVEVNEDFVLTLSNPSQGLVIGGTGTATGIILNDDVSLASIIPATQTLAEGGAGSGAGFSFSVQLDQPSLEAQSLFWSVSGTGTNAAAPSDFAAATQDFPEGLFPSGSLSFAPGQTSQSFTVPVLGERFVEPDETFAIQITSASSDVQVSAAVATATITNDDVAQGSSAILNLVQPVEFDWLLGFT